MSKASLSHATTWVPGVSSRHCHTETRERNFQNIIVCKQALGQRSGDGAPESLLASCQNIPMVFLKHFTEMSNSDLGKFIHRHDQGSWYYTTGLTSSGWVTVTVVKLSDLSLDKSGPKLFKNGLVKIKCCYKNINAMLNLNVLCFFFWFEACVSSFTNKLYPARTDQTTYVKKALPEGNAVLNTTPQSTRPGMISAHD